MHRSPETQGRDSLPAGVEQQGSRLLRKDAQVTLPGGLGAMTAVEYPVMLVIYDKQRFKKRHGRGAEQGTAGEGV